MLNLQVIFTSLGEVTGTIAVVAIAVFVIEIVLYFLLARVLKWQHALPIMLLAPGIVGILALIAWPLIFEAFMAFTNWNISTLRGGYDIGVNVLWGHLTRIFAGDILQGLNFWPLLFRTLQWTFIQVAFHVTFGLAIAMLLNRPMKVRGIYRTILLTPWAIPQIVAVLVMRGEFSRYGFPNQILQSIGMDRISWQSEAFWNWISINVTNIWLGVPFMMVILLGGLQSIDGNYYEAAEMDGGGWLTKFRHITLPLLQPVMTPAVILGVIWTFNLFNIPYFLNPQELQESEILVTALFRVFYQVNQYGLAAAFAFVIFFMLIGFAIFYMRVTNFEPVQGESKKAPRSKAVGE